MTIHDTKIQKNREIGWSKYPCSRVSTILHILHDYGTRVPCHSEVTAASRELGPSSLMARVLSVEDRRSITNIVLQMATAPPTINQQHFHSIRRWSMRRCQFSTHILHFLCAKVLATKWSFHIKPGCSKPIQCDGLVRYHLFSLR